MNLLLVVAVMAMGCRIQAADLVWDTSEWQPILLPCPTCRTEKTVDEGKIVARSPDGSLGSLLQASLIAEGDSITHGSETLSAGHRTTAKEQTSPFRSTFTGTSIHKASLVTIKPKVIQRKKPQPFSSPAGVQLIYLPEGSLQQLTSAKAARIVPGSTTRQQHGNFVQVSPPSSPSLVQNVEFSDKQKRDHSGRVIGGGVSNVLPVSILTTPDQQQNAKEKLKLLEAALRTPGEKTPKEDGRLPRVFIAPSNVPPPPGYIKIPLVPHGEPGVSSVTEKDGSLPQTFLTSDKSSPPPGFIKFDLPEGVSQLSRDIPVVVPNDIPQESSGFNFAFDALGINRQPRTSKNQGPSIQTIPQDDSKLSISSSKPRPEQQELPQQPLPPRGQTHQPPPPGQAPGFLQINQPHPNQAVRQSSQTKQSFPERSQFPQVQRLQPNQFFPPPGQSPPQPGSPPRPDASSPESGKSSLANTQTQRQQDQSPPSQNQPFSQTDRPTRPKEPTPQINQLLLQSELPTQSQKHLQQPQRPVPQRFSPHFVQPSPRPTPHFTQFNQAPSQARPPFPQPGQQPSQLNLSFPNPGPPSQSGRPFPQQGQRFPQTGQQFPQNGQPFSQQEQRFPQPGQQFPQSGRPFPQSGQPFPQPGQQFLKPGQQFPQSGRPFPQSGQPFPQPGQPFPQSGRPIPQSGQQFLQSGRPFPQPGQPSSQSGRPFPQPEQLQLGRPFQQPGQASGQTSQSSTKPSQSRPEQPSEQPSKPTIPPSPSKQFDQPLPQDRQPPPPPGQSFPQPGRPFPQSGQSLPQPGQQFSQSGQPIPQSGRPFSQSGQQFSQPGRPFPQPGQQFPQPGQISHPLQPNQPDLHPGQSSPQSNQPAHLLPHQPFPQPGQTFPQPGQPFPQAGSPVTHFGPPRQTQPPSTSPSPSTTSFLNHEPSPTPELRRPSTSQDTPRPTLTSPSTPSPNFTSHSTQGLSSTFQPPTKPRFTSQSTLRQSPTPQPTPRPNQSSTFQPSTSPRFTSQPTQRPSPTFQPPTSPRFTSQPTQRPSPTFQPPTSPRFTSQPTQRPSSTFQPSGSPVFTSQPTQRPSSTFQPTQSPRFTSLSTSRRTTPVPRITRRPGFTSQFTVQPRFPPNPFISQNEQSSSEPSLILQTSPSTTPSPTFPSSTGSLEPASQAPVISIPGAVSQALPESVLSFPPRPIGSTLRPQPISTVEFSESPPPSERPFVSSTLRPQPVSFSGFPRPLLSSTLRPQPVSFSPRPLNLPTFAPFGVNKRPSSSKPETEKKTRQRPRARIPSFRKPQKPSTIEQEPPVSPDFSPFRPPTLTSTGIEEQTSSFQPEVTTEEFLSTVSSTRPVSSTTTTTPRVTTFKPRFNFNISNRRPFLRRKHPSSAQEKENEEAAKKETDTTFKKDGGEKKTEAVTLFPPFSVARTLNPLRAQKEGSNDEGSSSGVTERPKGVFGRRLKPRTRRPLSRKRLRPADSVTSSDVAEEVTSATIAPTKDHIQTRNRGNPTGLKGRQLPDWLKARRRNRARGRSRETEALRETEKKQVEDAPLDILENNGFNGAESTVVEFSRPPENKVERPLSPHDALKQLAEDATDAANEGIAELLDAASEAGSEYVSTASQDYETETDTVQVDIPREHTVDFYGSPDKEGETADAEYTDDVPVVAEPEPEPEPEPETQGETFDDAATTQLELQHPPQYVSEDDLQDKPETPLPSHHLSELPSSHLSPLGSLRATPPASPAPQTFPRPQPTFSRLSTENLNDGSTQTYIKEDHREALALEDITDTHDSDHNGKTTVAVVSTSNTDEGEGVTLGQEELTTELPETPALFPNNQFTTLSPGESQDYYVYEYDDLYDDHAEQSEDQKFGGSRAEVVFAVPVTEYEYNPEDTLITTPAAEIVVELSESSPADFKVTTLTPEGTPAVTEASQVAISDSMHTFNVLDLIDVPQVTKEVPQVTEEVPQKTEEILQPTEIPQVAEEIFEVTEEEPQVTDEIPEVTTEDTVPETTTESVVSGEANPVTGAYTIEEKVEEQQPQTFSSSPRPATPLITFLPFPSTTPTIPTTTTPATTTSRRRLVPIRPLHARILGARKKKLSSGASSVKVKKDSNALKIVGKSTVAEVQSSDPVVCFPGLPCVRAVGVGRLLRP